MRPPVCIPAQGAAIQKLSEEYTMANPTALDQPPAPPPYNPAPPPYKAKAEVDQEVFFLYRIMGSDQPKVDIYASAYIVLKGKVIAIEARIGNRPEWHQDMYIIDCKGVEFRILESRVTTVAAQAAANATDGNDKLLKQWDKEPEKNIPPLKTK
jgi:hypothetical protein